MSDVFFPPFSSLSFLVLLFLIFFFFFFFIAWSDFKAIWSYEIKVHMAVFGAKY